MTTIASLDELLSRPGRVLGTWTQIAHADVIDALGHAGYAFTIIDCEHGDFGIETAAGLIRACEAAGVGPLVRVPRGDTIMAGKTLDAGALGVLAPGVDDAAGARAMVAAARFAPAGLRGACPIVRAAAHSARPWGDVVRQQSGNGVLAMIETTAGVEAVEAIVAVEGLKGVVVGPFDLAVSAGLEGDYRHPRVRAALEHVIEVARQRGLPVLMPVFAAQEAELRSLVAHWAGRGVRHFAIGADKIFFAQAASRFLGWAS